MRMSRSAFFSEDAFFFMSALLLALFCIRRFRIINRVTNPELTERTGNARNMHNVFNRIFEIEVVSCR